MHKQVSEKQMAANGERSADRAFRSAALDSQETITKGNGVGPRRRGDRRKNGPKGPNEPSKLFRIMELTYGTNPHEPKTKPVSPLDLIGLLKRTQNQATKSFRFGWAKKRTQMCRDREIEDFNRPTDLDNPYRRATGCRARVATS